MGIIRFLHNNKNDRIGNKTTTTGAKVALWVVAWSILQPGDYLQLRQLLTHLMINNVAVKDVTLSMCFRYIGFYCISLYWICNFDDKQQFLWCWPGKWKINPSCINLRESAWSFRLVILIIFCLEQDDLLQLWVCLHLALLPCFEEIVWSNYWLRSDLPWGSHQLRYGQREREIMNLLYDEGTVDWWQLWEEYHC